MSKFVGSYSRELEQPTNKMSADKDHRKKSDLEL